jgi:hypothetical protein
MHLYKANLAFEQGTANGGSGNLREQTPDLPWDYPCNFKFKDSPLNLYLINTVKDIFGVFSLKCV